MAGIYNFPIHYKGDTWCPRPFTISVDGSPLDLTNISINSKFRFGAKDGKLQKSFNIYNGITKTDPVNGVFQFDETIINWNRGIYYYDIQFTDSLSKVITYIEGTQEITQDTTY